MSMGKYKLMFCPKCGSEMVAPEGMPYGFENCPKCINEINTKRANQQELDEVLSRFKDDKYELCESLLIAGVYQEIRVKSSLFIKHVAHKEQFYLGTHTEVDGYDREYLRPISLKTVKSLLEDLDNGISK